MQLSWLFSLVICVKYIGNVAVQHYHTYTYIGNIKMTHYVLAASEWLNFGGVMDFFRNLKRNYELNKNIRATIKELNALTDKELNDIGLTRGDIWSVAHESYLDNQDKVEYNRNLKGWI